MPTVNNTTLTVPSYKTLAALNMPTVYTTTLTVPSYTSLRTLNMLTVNSKTLKAPSQKTLPDFQNNIEISSLRPIFLPVTET